MNGTNSTISSPVAGPIPFTARPIPLSDVRLTGGPLKHAQDLVAQYLLELEPDRMMAYYRVRVGLEPKAPGYEGWDGEGRNLTGHIAGHYLSAVSLMFAATGDARFQERADYVVKEMSEVQAANGDGYLGALENGKERFQEVAHGDIRSGGFDLNGLWAPWYVLHKTYAGLRDAYRWTGNKLALELEVRFAEWAETILADLTEEQIQKMLKTEFGGMNEAFVDLYADTKDLRWLALADRFEHHEVTVPFARRKNVLGGLHGNTQIPKLIGTLSRYIQTGRKQDGVAARFFWDSVVKHHTFATGGHGKDEYFGPPDELSERVDGSTDEACNIYNMLKMTRTLFALEPDIRYAEFHERALFNHVLGSIDPEDGRMCYMVPVGRGVEHEYQDKFHDFTCCVGSGMESHALHGDGIYYEAGDRLWVNLYAPSTADWRSAGVRLTMDTSLPEGDDATLTLSLATPSRLTLALRRPSWAGAGFTVSVNGAPVADLAQPGWYVKIDRTWRDGDIVTLSLPKALYTEALPDNSNRVALLWGPLVLAGDLGPEQPIAPISAPIFIAAGVSPTEWLKPVGDLPGHFRSDGVGRDSDNAACKADVDFVPFFRLHRRTYSAYWDLYTPQDWVTKSVEVAAMQEKKRLLEAATVAYAQPGEMQPERDYNLEEDGTTPDRVLGRPGRRGKGWFSFDLPIDPAYPMAVTATYQTLEFQPRTFDILVDGERIGEHAIERSRPGSANGIFHDVEYAIPAELAAGKEKVTVRFEATQGNEIGGVFGVRMVRPIPPPK
ncbi:MAG: beta-L-arabinofuranosidase domain-containing protein [Capsulimonas sp.]|uniref:beta-L-arabinofuranosidase domain-containing protein n=1 Tax=Capsulimonas sp. TaxID=2494211 RepID=UPI0032659437